jgi:hypothetical protein
MASPPVGWKKLMSWTFKGKRFDDHGVALEDLSRLSRLRDLLVETAADLWKKENPDRERLPKGFERHVQLKLFDIGIGSAVADIYYPAPRQGMILGTEPTEDIVSKLPRAAEAVVQSVRAVRDGIRFPDDLPARMVPRIADLAETLSEDTDEYFEISVPTGSHATLNWEVSRKLISASPSRYADEIDVVGEVTAASLKGKASIDVSGTSVEIRFSPEQERLVTGALYEHELRRIRIRGRGTIDPATDRLTRISEVAFLEVIEGTQRQFDLSAPSVLDLVAEAQKGVPDDVWTTLPHDAAANVDRYLRGQRYAKGSSS